jgi:hypothetical protein
VLRVHGVVRQYENNKNNPDSDQWVGFGDRTVDEMGHAWINITYMSDSEYENEVAQRRVKLANLVNKTKEVKLPLQNAAAVASSFVVAAIAKPSVLRLVRQDAKPVVIEPIHESGQGITGSFEGWYPNIDGTFSLLVGYLNRNSAQILDIPVGPNNRIEPGGPDQGQPTHFLPRRQWGVLSDRGSERLR